ncbi:MAG: response regulator [Myxococcota bacterium]
MHEASERPQDDDAKRELEDEFDALVRLVSGVSHDVNNLATAIRTGVDTLRRLPDDAPESAREEPLAIIDRAAAQASGLTSALASFGRREVQVIAAELGSVVEEAASFLRRALRAEIEVEVAAEAPRARPCRDGQRLVRVDRARLVRALIQLCTRAARAEGRILLAATGTREISIVLAPKDAGGPSAAPLEHEVTRAKLLLEGIDGALPLCCADGRGGFSASLRLSSAPPATLVVPRETGRGAAAQRGRALIAEDHSQVRDALIDALSRCGFTVEAVGDGDAFVDRGIAEAGKHDVFLIDFDLPGRDGATALEALREAGIRTPALMISGNIDFGSRIEGIENAQFLQKPFGLADIRAWATRQLESDEADAGAAPA